MDNHQAELAKALSDEGYLLQSRPEYCKLTCLSNLQQSTANPGFLKEATQDAAVQAIRSLEVRFNITRGIRIGIKIGQNAWRYPEHSFIESNDEFKRLF